MKKVHFGVALVTLFALFAFTEDPNPMLGRWGHTRKVGNDTYKFLYIFRADNSVDLIINDKAFASGKYRVSNDTVRVSDANCNAAYWGTYNLKFHTPDSVTIMAISDTCTGRKEGMSGETLVKVKKP